MQIMIRSPFVIRDTAVFALTEGYCNAERLLFVLGKQVCIWTPKQEFSWLLKSRKKDNFLLI